MREAVLRLSRSGAYYLLVAVAISCLVGCGPKSAKSRYKETTESFVGKVLQDGKPITLPEGARLDIVHDETYSRFGVPLKPDGSFTIGWMPTGKYSVELTWLKGGTTLTRHRIADGLTIEKDKSEYQLDVGTKWQP